MARPGKRAGPGSPSPRSAVPSAVPAAPWAWPGWSPLLLGVPLTCASFFFLPPGPDARSCGELCPAWDWEEQEHRPFLIPSLPVCTVTVCERAGWLCVSAAGSLYVERNTEKQALLLCLGVQCLLPQRMAFVILMPSEKAYMVMVAAPGSGSHLKYLSFPSRVFTAS